MSALADIGPAKSRIDRRLVVYPAQLAAIAGLGALIWRGGEKVREIIATGLVEVLWIIVGIVMLGKGAQQVLEYFFARRFWAAPSRAAGDAEPPPAPPPAPPPPQPG